MFAAGLYHGGTLKGVHWTLGPHPIIAILLFIGAWEPVGTICFCVVALPVVAVGFIFPESRASKAQRAL